MHHHGRGFAMGRIPRSWSGDLARADQIHRFPAKMALGLAECFIDDLALPALGGDPSGLTFHDPFCGSGTTLLVARARGLSVTGSDILPEAVQIALAKVNRLNRESVEKLARETLRNPLTYRRTPRWTWPTWSRWYTGRTLRAIQDLSIDLRRRRPTYSNHALVALSAAAWDVSSADPMIMVPTHSSRSRGARPFKPATVRAAYHTRIRRIISAQKSLERLEISESHARIWRGNALNPAAWPARPNTVLCSPPYGTGIDYVRASSMNGAAIRPGFATSVRSEMLGRGKLDLEPVYPLPSHIADAVWASHGKREQPRRFRALLQYLIELESFLTTARDRLSSDSVLGLVVGNPELARNKVPIVRLAHDIAQSVGFKDLHPPIRDRIRRRFQATKRRDSDRPITHEVLFALVPN